MKCEQCQSFKAIANTDETGQGICSFPNSWMPVHKDDECHFIPSAEVKCKDCDRLCNDFACMTCEPEDSAMHGEHLCGGFIDKYELEVAKAIQVWKARGWDYNKILQKVVAKVENAPQPKLKGTNNE